MATVPSVNLTGEEAFYGDAVFVNGAAETASWGSPAVINHGGSGTRTIGLPDLSIKSPVGGPHFVIVNTGSGTLNIRNFGGTLVQALSANQVGRCYLKNSTTWYVRVTTLNTSRTWNHGSFSSIVAPESTAAPTVSCFEGDDCELADFHGLVPLDGEDGRPLVVAPFFQDVTVHAQNYSREAIRAADLVMPSVIPVGFARDEFEPDPLHALAATVLSDEFYTALYNNNRSHPLVYLGTAHGVSRHWHQIRYGGVIPTLGWFRGDGFTDPTVKRHVWQRLVPYTTAGGSEFTLTIRYVMEHTVDPEPNWDDPPTGGENDHDVGAWGCILNVYVFTNELEPSFEDGDTFTPTGAASPVEFSLDDPCSWEGTDKKFCHPQMVICANVPTTFQNPMGYDWVPVVERRWLREWLGGFTLRGKNREHCYKWSNGAPWTPGTCTDDAPAGPGDLRNVVFGWDITSVSGGAITMGGDFPRSRPPDYLTIENGLGVGRTYLRPGKPGWDEACGTLDVAGGSSISVTHCVDDKYGPDVGDGRHEWPRYEPDACRGHPNEPFEGAGGSHTCFNNYGASNGTQCCWAIDEALAGGIMYCKSDYYVFGDRDAFGACTIVKSRCASSAYLFQIVMELEDYYYAANGDPNGRLISWVRPLPVSPIVLFPYEYDVAEVGDFSQEFGTWGFTASITVTAVAGSSPRALLTYEPSGHNYRDYQVKVQFQSALSKKQGVSLRGDWNGVRFVGYVFELSPTGGSNATLTLKKYDSAGSVTTIASTNITNLTTDTVDVEAYAWGSELYFKATYATHTLEMTEQDCEIETGPPGLWMDTNATGAVFANFEVEDWSTQFSEAESIMDQDSSSVTVPLAHRSRADGICDSIENPDCGFSPVYCNCTYTEHQTIYNETATFSGPGDITDDENPNYWTGPSAAQDDCDGNTMCPDGTPPCRICPPTFRSLWFAPYATCEDIADENVANFCKGLQFWNYSLIACS